MELLDLPNELLESIVKKLCDESHPLMPVQSLSLVCTRLRWICAKFLFRKISINIIQIPLVNESVNQCQKLLGCLQTSETLKSNVEYIDIPLPPTANSAEIASMNLNPSHQVRLNSNLIGLLPLLPKLKGIKFGFSKEIFALDHRAISVFQSLLTAMHYLPRLVDVSLASYSHMLKPLIKLDTLSHLTALRVCLLQHDYEVNDEEPAQEVAEIISKSPKLEKLWITLMERFEERQDEKYLLTQLKALETIGPAIRQLQKLTLEGDFYFSEIARSHWVRIFGGLRRLTLIGPPAVWNVLNFSPGSFGQLEVLNIVSPYHDGTNVQGDGPPLTNFFSQLSLVDLQISGMEPRAIVEILSSRPNGITNLGLYCFERYSNQRHHINSTRVADARDSLTDLLVSSLELEKLLRACTELQKLRLDVADVVRPPPDYFNRFPMGSPRPSPFERMLPSPPPLSSRPIIPIDLQILKLLASAPALRQLLLHVKPEREVFGQKEIKTEDILATYQYIRSRKIGLKLSKLTIISERRNRRIWEMWEHGRDRVVVRYHAVPDRLSARPLEILQQIWVKVAEQWVKERWLSNTYYVTGS